jgi:hypothetical protein
MRDTISKEDKKAIQEWLDKGNEIEVCPSGAITEDIVHTFGSKKKKKTTHAK